MSGDLLLTLVLVGLFAAYLALHLVDLQRRRQSRARIRSERDWGPNAAAVEAVLASAGRLDAVAAERLARRRRAAFEWDPRLEKIPKVGRTARNRAFANERDDRALAAAEEAQTRAEAALGHAPQGASVREAADCAAETAGAIVAAPRISGVEFRMLTRAWREVVGPIDVRARQER